MTLRSALLHTALAKCKNAAACPPADALHDQAGAENSEEMQNLAPASTNKTGQTKMLLQRF